MRVKNNLFQRSSGSKKVDWLGLLEEFLQDKRLRGRRERTINDYRRYVNEFFKCYPNLVDWRPGLGLEVFRKCVLEYFQKYYHMTAATFNIRLVYLRAFLAWCKNKGIFGNNPIDGIKKSV